jgi:hypothetical protein
LLIYSNKKGETYTKCEGQSLPTKRANERKVKKKNPKLGTHPLTSQRKIYYFIKTKNIFTQNKYLLMNQRKMFQLHEQIRTMLI